VMVHLRVVGLGEDKVGLCQTGFVALEKGGDSWIWLERTLLVVQMWVKVQTVGRVAGELYWTQCPIGVELWCGPYNLIGSTGNRF